MAYRIDYFQQIKAFDYLCLTTLTKITASQRSVYHALLSINNSTYWSENCEIDFKYILDLSRVDKDTYRRAMDFFYENNLLDAYTKGINHYARAKVTLKVLHEISVGNTVTDRVNNAVPNTVSDAHFNKTVNTKTLKLKNKKIDFDLIFNDEVFINSPEDLVNVFKKWFEYKKSVNQPYKTSISLITAFKNLKSQSAGKFEIAEQIIDQSIGNEWKGLFPLKNGQSNKNKTAPSRAQELLEQHERLTKMFDTNN